jgi:hypothetical protein
MSLKSQLYKSIRSMPSCVAGGYIDLGRDELVAMLAVETYPRKELERLVGITEDLFQGANVVMIEEIFKKARGKEDKQYHLFQEIVVTANDFIYIFFRANTNKNHIISFITSTSDKLVLLLTKARSEVVKLEAAFRAERERTRF